MKTLYLTLLLFTVSKLEAVHVFYDADTNRILSIGNSVIAETEKLKKGQCDDNDPLIKEDLTKLRWDPGEGLLKKKSNIELQEIENKKKKMDLLNKYRLLRRQESDARQDVVDGIDPVIDPNSIRQSANVVKSEYLQINVKGELP